MDILWHHASGKRRYRHCAGIAKPIVFADTGSAPEFSRGEWETRASRSGRQTDRSRSPTDRSSQPGSRSGRSKQTARLKIDGRRLMADRRQIEQTDADTDRSSRSEQADRQPDRPTPPTLTRPPAAPPTHTHQIDLPTPPPSSTFRSLIPPVLFP